jgi:phosphoserine phosphatase
MSKVTIIKMLGKILFVDVPIAKIASFRRRILPGKGTIVMLDLDDTLIKTNSSLELLVQVIGAEKAKKRYQYYRSLVKNGKMSLQQAQIESHQEMVDAGATIDQYQSMVERVVREGKVRKDVLRVAKYLQSIGRKVVIVTKSSQVIGDLFANKFELDGSIGTLERFENGKLQGIESLVGDKKSRTVKVKTKMRRMKEWCRKRGVPFSPQNVSLITDSYDDYLTLRKVGLGILYVPKKSETHQKIAEKFGLGDFQIEEIDPLHEQRMKLALRFPKATVRVKKRIQRQRKKRA